MRDTLAGIARLASLEGHAPRQASPLRQHDIHRIIHTAREPRNNQPGGKPETAEQARRRGDLETAMILIAYDAALRASELLALRWSDIEPSEDSLGARVLIRRSKTDQTAKGAVAPISARTLAADHTPLARHHRKPPQTPPAPNPASQLSTTAIQLAKQCLELIGRRVEQAKNNLERSQQALNPRAHAEDTRAPPC